jgi:hypothetical protein
MMEGEWLSRADPKPMLRFLLGTSQPRVQAVEHFPDCIASDRKLRLFACACYHRIRHLLPDPRARVAVEVAERVVDGLLPEVELRRAEAHVREPSEELEGRWRASRGAERIALQPTHAALALAGVILWAEPQKAAYYAASNASHTLAAITNPAAASYDGAFSASETAEGRAQTELLRCIFGPPLFRPVSLDPSWLAWCDGSVVRLAQAIYAERRFEDLPILADALEEAGCTDASILDHLRGPGPHTRGCWPLDLSLGKK